jgi:hypothetical protein
MEENESNIDTNEFWEEQYDPNSGRNYWYNTITEETTWINPHARLVILNFIYFFKSLFVSQ